MVEFFKSGVAINSLNFPTLDPKQMDSLSPWFSLSESVGSFAAQVLKGAPESINLDFEGKINEFNLKPLQVAAAKGVLSPIYGEEVNLVNAPLLLEEKNIKLQVNKKEPSENSDSILTFTLTGSEDKVKVKAAVTVSGPVILAIDSFSVEVKPIGTMLYIKNQDVPKVVAELTRQLGEENVNIASLQLARKEKGGDVLTLIQVDEKVSDTVLEKMQGYEFVNLVKQLSLAE